jgi:hypothetical protein
MAAVTAAVATVVGGAVAANQASKARDSARSAKANAEAEMARIKAARKPIVNPFGGNYSLAGQIQNMRGDITNPFANLGVATMAAEFQAEQADIALANTLDNLAASGASAGGATALAQAALASKKGVAATIEKQEAENSRLKAQGEQRAQQLRLSEDQRYQAALVQEGQRLQTQDAAGKQFVIQASEARSNLDLNHAAGQYQQAMASEASANQAMASAWGSAISGVAGIGSASVAGQASIAAAGYQKDPTKSTFFNTAYKEIS